MKLPSKNVKNREKWDFAIQCDQIRRHRVPESCGWCFRSFLSCQNPLNCHMGQNIVLGGHFLKWIFAEGSFNQKPLAFRENPRTHLEVQGPFDDEGTFQNSQNPENLRFHNSVRPDPAAPGPRKLRVVFPLISVLSKPPQLPLGITEDHCGFNLV